LHLFYVHLVSSAGAPGNQSQRFMRPPDSHGIHRFPIDMIGGSGLQMGNIPGGNRSGGPMGQGGQRMMEMQNARMMMQQQRGVAPHPPSLSPDTPWGGGGPGGMSNLQRLVNRVQPQSFDQQYQTGPVGGSAEMMHSPTQAGVQIRIMRPPYSPYGPQPYGLQNCPLVQPPGTQHTAPGGQPQGRELSDSVADLNAIGELGQSSQLFSIDSAFF